MFFNFANNEGSPLVNPLLGDAQANLKTLDERITQLESIAQWLNMNLQMVNASAQQLQVQKQTLQALAQWQELTKMGGGNTEETKTSTDAAPAAAFEQMAQSWWDALQTQFGQIAEPLVQAEKPAAAPKKRAVAKPKKAAL